MDGFHLTARTYLEGNALRGLAGMTKGHGALGRSISATCVLPVAGEDELEGRFRRYLQRMRRCGGHLLELVLKMKLCRNFAGLEMKNRD